MRWHYRRMFLLALFYQASLDIFARDIAKITRHASRFGGGRPTGRDRRDRSADQHEFDTPGFRNSLEPQRRRLMRFVNGLWFDEVTPQIQGIELFERMHKHLRLRMIYKEIKGEIEASDDYQRDHALATLSYVSTRATQGALTVAKIAAGFAIISLLLQFIDVLSLKAEIGASLFLLAEWSSKALIQLYRYIEWHPWSVLMPVLALLVLGAAVYRRKLSRLVAKRE
jgi:hypothetical protein